MPGGHNFNNYANVNLIVSTAVSQRVDAVWPGALVNTAMQKLRIVTCGISGGRTLTRPLRDARRFHSTRSYPVPRSSRTPRKFRILSIVQGSFSVVQQPGKKIGIALQRQT